MATFDDLRKLYDATPPFTAADVQAAQEFNVHASNGHGPGPAAVISQPSANGHAEPSDQTASPVSIPLPIANEADNDPHRLATSFLSRTPYAAILYHEELWWRSIGTKYIPFNKGELVAKINKNCKQEFDRLNIEALQSGSAATSDGKAPEPLKVTRPLVSNVIAAMEGMCLVGDGQQMQSWIESELPPDQPRPSNNCISLANGILDLDELLSETGDQSRILLPHSPAWFSPISLPYNFEPDAECPKWNAFMHRNLEGDWERIAVLQEWAGYLLLPDTSQQKFLFLEGEGSNGKSVYYAAIEAMLGKENVSHVPLESFGERFALSSTIGKLANIAADCGELDKTAEGTLKSFTAGDRMTIDRKGISPIETSPTARLMIAANNRPRFSDRSRGLWRRLMIVPFNVQITDEEKVRGMDKPEWWQASGELPGILRWAVEGLWRLRQQGCFTRTSVGELALADYRNEVNPARAFIDAVCRVAESQISSAGLYSAYKSWAKENGYHPINERNFFKEVVRAFPNSEKRRIGSDGHRSYVYFGIFADGIDF